MIHLEEKSDRLHEYLAGLNGPVAIAFSGGVDSACLLGTAMRTCRYGVIAILMDSVFLAGDEREWAIKLAMEMGAELHIIEWKPLEIEAIRENGPGRCYYCKYHMYSVILQYLKKRRIKFILDGTHADDMKSDRPGYRAILEHGVKTPMADAGITKQEIRHMAAGLPMSVAEKPSQSCLATRIGHGQKLEGELLEAVEKIEICFKKAGCWHVRCRVDDGNAAIITGDSCADKWLACYENILTMGYNCFFKELSLTNAASGYYCY